LALPSCERITGTPCILNYTCTSAAGTAFDKGDLVSLDVNGTLLIAAEGTATATAGIWGIAMMDAPASTTTQVPVDVISSDGSLFAMTSAETAAAAQIGEMQVITYTAGAHTITSGSGNAIIVGYLDDIGTTTPRCIVRFRATSLQSEVGW